MWLAWPLEAPAFHRIPQFPPLPRTPSINNQSSLPRGSRLSSVLHGLLHMADHDGSMTSELSPSAWARVRSPCGGGGRRRSFAGMGVLVRGCRTGTLIVVAHALPFLSTLAGQSRRRFTLPQQDILPFLFSLGRKTSTLHCRSGCMAWVARGSGGSWTYRQAPWR